jgi:hypothetical protein
MYGKKSNISLMKPWFLGNTVKRRSQSVESTRTEQPAAPMVDAAAVYGVDRSHMLASKVRVVLLTIFGNLKVI